MSGFGVLYFEFLAQEAVLEVSLERMEVPSGLMAEFTELADSEGNPIALLQRLEDKA